MSNSIPAPRGVRINTVPRDVHSLGRISGTHPRAENIDNVPAMMQIFSMQTLEGRQTVVTLDVSFGQNFNFINKILYKQF